VETGRFERTLAELRVYRGLPSSTRDPKGFGAARAQIDAWSKLPGVTPISRPLRYLDTIPPSKPEEKGIDVAIAVDFVMGAVKGSFDVGIVMSLDTDLKPALEAVANQLHGVRVEVAAWNRPDRRCGRLSIQGHNLWCHWLDDAVYEAVRDTTDYVRADR
jgi:hypothetical protein